MNKLFLGWILAILSACTTSNNTQTPLTFSNGHTARFVVGDCIKYFVGEVNGVPTDGTPKQVIYVDNFETYNGDGGYILRMVHPKVGHPTYHAFSVTSVDKTHTKTDCLD